MVFLLVFKVASVSRTGFTKHHDIGCFLVFLSFCLISCFVAIYRILYQIAKSQNHKSSKLRSIAV